MTKVATTTMYALSARHFAEVPQILVYQPAQGRIFWLALFVLVPGLFGLLGFGLFFFRLLGRELGFARP